MTQKEIILDIQHLQKSFGEHSVLKDVSFSLYKGSVISILGSSGSGKSTFLRCINPVSYTHLTLPTICSV